MNRNRLSLYFPSRLHNALVFREASASQHACLPSTNEYAPCSRILFQQAQLPPLNRNLCPPDSDIAGRRRMLEPAKLSDFGSHDFADHFADIPRTGSHEKSPPSKMRKLARAIAKD